MTINKIFQDELQNDQVYNVDPEKHQMTFLNRVKRTNTAYSAYIKNVYQEYPRSDLATLINRKSRLQAMYDRTASGDYLLRVQEIQSKIDNLDYCVEGTPEYNTRQEFLSYSSNFQWPDANELVLRQQEEDQLLALIGQ